MGWAPSIMASMRGRTVNALLWIAVGLQAATLIPSGWHNSSSRLDARAALMSDGLVRSRARLAAYRALGRITDDIPLDAPVLLIDSSPLAMPYSFHFRPRPFVSLLNTTRADLEAKRDEFAHLYWALEMRFMRFETRDLLFTEESLARELPRSRFLVFYPREVEVEVPGHRLELVRREDRATLYRVVHEESE